MGKLFCLMGKSASGKDAIFRYLKENKALELKEIVPYTTRPMRKGEENGVGYYFVDNAAYEAMRREGKVIESRSYDTIQGKWHYFTADDGQINLSEGSSILIGTLEVYVQLKKYFGEDQVVLTDRIFRRRNWRKLESTEGMRIGILINVVWKLSAP